MIKYSPASQLSFANFEVLSFQSLDSENRWVKLADLVPWDKLAMTLVLSPDAPKLKGAGRPTLDLRLVLAALLVQQLEALSDVRTLELIRENIYVQYFCGLSGFQASAPFEASSLTHWRKWLGHNGARELNEVVANELVQFPNADASSESAQDSSPEQRTHDTKENKENNPNPPVNPEPADAK